MKTTHIKIKELNTCEDVLRIRPVNAFFVSRYRQAMRNGDQFPPLIVEKGTNRIVAGNTRYEAYLAEYGEEKAVPCILKSYASPAELIEDAVRDNAKHGNPLDGISRRRAALRLAELGRDHEAIARLLGVSCKQVHEWGGQVVIVRGTKAPQPVKRGLEHMSGQKVSVDNYKTHIKTDRGVPIAQQAKQLSRWIRNGWVDMTDPKTSAAIGELKEAIETL